MTAPWTSEREGRIVHKMTMAQAERNMDRAYRAWRETLYGKYERFAAHGEYIRAALAYYRLRGLID